MIDRMIIIIIHQCFNRFANNLKTVCPNKRIFSLILVVYDSIRDMDTETATLIDELILEIDVKVRAVLFWLY